MQRTYDWRGGLRRDYRRYLNLLRLGRSCRVGRGLLLLLLRAQVVVLLAFLACVRHRGIRPPWIREVKFFGKWTDLNLQTNRTSCQNFQTCRRARPYRNFFCRSHHLPFASIRTDPLLHDPCTASCSRTPRVLNIDRSNRMTSPLVQMDMADMNPYWVNRPLLR